jgi:hypothetical protein
MSSGLITLLVFLDNVLLLVFWFIAVYNGLVVSRRNRTSNWWRRMSRRGWSATCEALNTSRTGRQILSGTLVSLA